jgi:hypothetical protein
MKANNTFPRKMKFGFATTDLFKYDKVASEGNLSEDESGAEEASQPSWLAKHTRYAILCLMTTAIVAAGLAVWFGQHFYKENLSPNCGRTATEARVKGCHYEPMQRSWIPDECYFSEPSEEYHPFDDREWYIDSLLKERLTDSELLKLRNGDDFVAYTKIFHDEHCLYSWRKLALTIERRLPYIGSKSADLMHSTHCSKRIANLIYEVGTNTYTEYNDTASYTASHLSFQTCIPLQWK